jgi:hypothetical protein
LRGYLATVSSRSFEGKPIEHFSEHIKAATRIKQSYFGAHVLSDAGGRVQGDGFPGSFYMFFRDLMCCQELTNCVGAVYFKAIGCTACLFVGPSR